MLYDTCNCPILKFDSYMRNRYSRFNKPLTRFNLEIMKISITEVNKKGHENLT